MAKAHLHSVHKYSETITWQSLPGVCLSIQEMSFQFSSTIFCGDMLFMTYQSLPEDSEIKASLKL